MMPRPRTRTIVVAAAAATVLALVGIGLRTLRTASAGTITRTGQVLPAAERPQAPVLDGKTLTGQHLSTADWPGKVIVVNFWGSWCAPCQKEAPSLQKVYTTTYREGVRFVGVDIRDNTASALAFERRYGVTYPSLDDSGTSSLDLRFKQLSPQATPSTYVIDRRGRIAAVFFGATTYDELYSAVELVVERG